MFLRLLFLQVLTSLFNIQPGSTKASSAKSKAKAKATDPISSDDEIEEVAPPPRTPIQS
jgi:hypothetical protein